MILCVSPSPAWDVTFHVPRLEEHATNRATSASARAGGKAVNVARLLRGLGEDARVVLPVGGRTGEDVVTDLDRSGIGHVSVPSAAATRSTVTLVSDESGDATVVNETGRLPEWADYLALVQTEVGAARLVVASGSLPSGAPVDAFAQVVDEARSEGVPVLVDTSGPALVTALAARPTLVKPNLAELREVTGDVDPRVGASRLARESGAAVAVSAGPDGLVLAVGPDAWHAALPHPLHGNPTGAGDAVVAALARGLVAGTSWPEALRDAVAMAGAAVLAPYAGEVTAADYAALLPLVTVTTVEVPA